MRAKNSNNPYCKDIYGSFNVTSMHITVQKMVMLCSKMDVSCLNIKHSCDGVTYIPVISRSKPSYLIVIVSKAHILLKLLIFLLT